MIKLGYIEELAGQYIDGTDLFLIRASVGKDNLISVFIDSIEGVTIDQCVKLSRYIEDNLDRDIEDFELRVSSPGADESFADIRQYKKNRRSDVQRDSGG